MNYKENVPFFETGLSVDRVCFSSGRTTASMMKHGGLMRIEYFGNHRMGYERFFETDPMSAWWHLFRLLIVVDGDAYYAEFNDTEIYPFGYKSHCEIKGVSLRHELTLLNDALVYEVTVLDNPEKAEVRCRIGITKGGTKAGPGTRTWSNFEPDAGLNALVVKAVDDIPEAPVSVPKEKKNTSLTQFSIPDFSAPNHTETFIGLTSDSKLAFKDVQFKNYAETEPLSDTVSISLAFACDDESLFQRRVSDLQRTAAAECRAVKEKLETTLNDQTQFNVENPVLQSFLSNVRPVIDSMRPADVPGGMRASDMKYWIWGWDTMVHSDAVMMSGNHAFMRDALQFYRETAHPEYGIFHAQTPSGDFGVKMAAAAQCIYAVMLYNHYVFSRDTGTVNEFYSFALSLVDRALEDRVGDTGLMTGVSVYPDHPEHADQDGNDISAFNNGIVFQAIRAMAKLANMIGRPEDAARLDDAADNLRDGYLKHLFDEEKGYFVDSVSSIDFSKRKHYPSYAILWLTPFAEELIGDHAEEIARFMRENHRQKIGASWFPRWDSCFMFDGNQLGQYMPVVEGFYRRMTKGPEAARDLEETISMFWKDLNIPESLSCEAVNSGLTVDNPGRKQAFCANSWYSLSVAILFGLEFGMDSLRISPPLIGSGKAVLSKLNFGGKMLEIVIDGEGVEIDKVLLDGIEVPAPYAIEFDELESDSVIAVSRK